MESVSAGALGCSAGWATAYKSVGLGAEEAGSPPLCLPSWRLGGAALPTCGAEGAQVLVQWLLLVMCCVLGEGEVVGLDRPRVSRDPIPAPLQLCSALAREPSVRELSEKRGGRGREMKRRGIPRGSPWEMDQGCISLSLYWGTQGTSFRSAEN